MAMGAPAVVMDCGSGYTKLGFAGNIQPAFVLPTAVCTPEARLQTARSNELADLEFTIGEEALGVSRNKGAPLVYPIKHGVVENWDLAEQYWEQCFYKYLRVEPEDHAVVVTEPPLNPPEAREAVAEVMFETFGVSGLFIGVQAVLALYASWAAAQSRAMGQGGVSHSLTGTVVDAGDGVTHIIPVVDNYVVSSAIRSLPVGGKEVTAFVQQLLRERAAPVPPDQSAETARRIKEHHCYVCGDVNAELSKYEADPSKIVRSFSVTNMRTNQPVNFDLGPERFLAPELFFTPGITPSAPKVSLPEMVDRVVQGCPIDTRRALYANVVLSGGSTMFPNFGRRLQRDLTALTSGRLAAGAKPVDVCVVSHPLQRAAVWFGGSVLASADEFTAICHSRADYLEHGPSICRTNYVFRDI